MNRNPGFWPNYFLRVAGVVSIASKDPSTQVGAVIVRPDRTMASFGFNGFPRGVVDSPDRLNDRPTKYSFTVHAEANAILTAREPLHGYTMYSTLFPCSDCAKLIIQSGIRFVCSPVYEVERWRSSFMLSEQMFREAGVAWQLIAEEDNAPSA
ncbi:dCMP deaminase family protein [Bradyrhizobium sp. 150]|uniref:deoxycytidylate deaminase n=1 Tax=Bradyrhizobium sp. 150 TaxID=2782625 RepID=UPI001FFB5509|nr:dCMP deaminase family protein [Bradyrhizobium sp. 150]